MDDTTIIIIILMAVVAFFIFRELLLWYWKVNLAVSKLESIEALLQEISHKLTPDSNEQNPVANNLNDPAIKRSRQTNV
ncbi:hypothetical protein [Paenibacillus sinopodophylli]|uniref:hypothetical protein n=1 Tax=Paenibacillus sinopodophylli TaxID=1837342 RepID=UPI00110CFB7A|nr:hypothetical protein [Paenibacillus sinopodophylli]